MERVVLRNSTALAERIRQEILRSDEARYDHRLHGVLLVCQGQSCDQVAALFGHSPRTIAGWVHRVRAGGLTALRDTPRPGRPARLDPALLATLATQLRQPPEACGYAQPLWDGRLLAHHLAAGFGVALGVRQCQRLFPRLGFSLQRPQPEPAGADPVAQAAFKKTPRPRRRSRRGGVGRG